jgi:hypothetical protein
MRDFARRNRPSWPDMSGRSAVILQAAPPPTAWTGATYTESSSSSSAPARAPVPARRTLSKQEVNDIVSDVMKQQQEYFASNDAL